MSISEKSDDRGRHRLVSIRHQRFSSIQTFLGDIFISSIQTFLRDFTRLAKGIHCSFSPVWFRPEIFFNLNFFWETLSSNHHTSNHWNKLHYFSNMVFLMAFIRRDFLQSLKVFGKLCQIKKHPTALHWDTLHGSQRSQSDFTQFMFWETLSNYETPNHHWDTLH